MFKLAIIRLDLSNTSEHYMIQNCLNRYKDARLLIDGLKEKKYLLIEKKPFVYHNFSSF